MKGVVNACIGQEQDSSDHLKLAQQYFQLVGGSASECGVAKRKNAQRETERQRDRERDRERQRDRERARARERERQRDRERARARERERQRERQRQRDRETVTERQRDRDARVQGVWEDVGGGEELETVRRATGKKEKVRGCVCHSACPSRSVPLLIPFDPALTCRYDCWPPVHGVVLLFAEAV